MPLHELPSTATLAETIEALDAELERPDDCSRPCVKHGGDEWCICGEGDEGTTSAPGGW